MAGGKPAQLFQALLLGSFYSRSSGQQFTSLNAHDSQPDLDFLAGLLASGQINPASFSRR